MWTDHLAKELENRNLGMAEFRAVLLRLLDKQVIYRHESQVEAELYDLFVRMQAGRGSLPGYSGHDGFFQSAPQFCDRLSAGQRYSGRGRRGSRPDSAATAHPRDEAGLMITLRLLYEEKIREGEIDEQGCVFVPLETVFTRYLSITQKEMPTAEAERRSLFNALKQLRIVAYSDLAGAEQWIGIREIIMHFTLNGIVEALTERETGAEAAESVDAVEAMPLDPTATPDSDQEDA
jgi:hypothetical protein